MFRNGKFKKLEHINVTLDNGGVGDCVAQMPAIKYIRDHAPNVVMHCWAPDYFVEFAKKLCPGVYIKSHSEAKKKHNPRLHTVKMSNPSRTNMGSHMVDVAFDLLVDKQVDIKHKNYLKLPVDNIDIARFNLPKKYIVLTTGFTAAVREMLPEIANEIIKYCNDRGVPVVMLGKYNTSTGSGHVIKGTFKPTINYHETVNLVDKTSLLEAAAIIAKAQCIVGLDTGLLHIAACTDVPIIYGFTSVAPAHRLPIRHDELGWNCYVVEPPENLECRGCQSNFIHVFDFDFRGCYYEDPIPKCIQSLTADKYIEHIKKFI